MPVNFAKIRDLREERKLNQQEAADRAKFAGLNGKVRWSNIESGRYENLSVYTLETVAWVLGVQAQDLLTPIDLNAPLKLHRKSLQNRRRPSGLAGSKG